MTVSLPRRRPGYEREVISLAMWHVAKPYCENPLYTNIWLPTRKDIIKVSHAFYMNDERDLDPFYLEYDR